MGIFPSLDFSDMETCVDCIKGKLTKIKKQVATRSSDLLEIIHIDINGPYSPTLRDNKYVIIFIDDFSCYGYIYLINENFDALKKLKIFKLEVEKQLGKFIKIIRLDRSVYIMVNMVI